MKSRESQITNYKSLIFLFVVCSLWLAVSPAEAAERFFEVKARKFSYTPNIIKVNRGDTVRIRLISEDVHHGFFVDGYGVKTSAHPGMDGSLQFIADKPGRYSFRCSVTCGEFHPYMIGYMTVRPNSRFWLYAVILLLIGFGSMAGITLVKKKNG